MFPRITKLLIQPRLGFCNIHSGEKQTCINYMITELESMRNLEMVNDAIDNPVLKYINILKINEQLDLAMEQLSKELARIKYDVSILDSKANHVTNGIDTYHHKNSDTHPNHFMASIMLHDRLIQMKDEIVLFNNNMTNINNAINEYNRI